MQILFATPLTFSEGHKISFKPPRDLHKDSLKSKPLRTINFREL